MATIPEILTPVEAVSYAWKRSIHGVKPEDAAAELRKIHGEHGTVTPEQIVERARDPENPLHEAFDWDDTTAAGAYRAVQAQYILRTLVVVYRKSSGELTPPVRYMVKLKSDVDDPAVDDLSELATEPRVYLPIRQVMDEAELRRRHRNQAFSELVHWRQRYKAIDDFATIFDEIDRLAAQINGAA